LDSPQKQVRIVYFVRNITVSGGVKVLFQHVRLLKQHGFDAALVTCQNKFPSWFGEPPVVVSESRDSRLAADVVVGTKPSDMQWLFRGLRDQRSILCHLCQGDDVGDLRMRLSRLLTWNAIRKAPLSRVVEVVTLLRRLRRYERSYRLPSVKMAVSAHLCQLLQQRYGAPCVEIPNGVDLGVFRRDVCDDQPAGSKPWRIVSVGRFDTVAKGIGDVLAAVAILKKAGYPIHFTRIAGEPISALERDACVVDEYRWAIQEGQVADILCKSHLLLAGSREAEGFGLPALEAMACGLPCVLTKVPCYLSFDPVEDFAHFVSVRNPRGLAEGVVNVMGDKSYREILRRRGREVAEQHSLEAVGKRLASFFARISPT
jgi:glycosyltransferase involved in cell wall biosynthesis